MTSSIDVRGTGDDAVAVRTWPAPPTPKANILLVPGLGEHSGRYEHVGRYLSDAGFRVASLDLPGNGRSGGRRAYMESIDLFLDALELASGDFGNDLPFVLMGHSMGGLTSLTYTLADRPKPDLLVLSAPWLGDKLPEWQRRLVLVLGRFAPKLEIPNPIDGSELSRDPAVGEAYDTDPHNYAKTTLQQGVAIYDAIDWARANYEQLSVPTYLLHGVDDPLVSPKYTAPLGELDHVTRRLWPNLRHESLNEPEWEAVLGEVVDWLDDQLTRLSAQP